MFSDGNTTCDSSRTQGFGGQTNPLTPQIQHQQNFHANGTAENMGSPGYDTHGLTGQTDPWTPRFQQQQSFHVNGTAPNMGSPQYEQSYAQGTGPSWNSQLDQHAADPFFGLFLFIIIFLYINRSYFWLRSLYLGTVKYDCVMLHFTRESQHH